MHNMKEELLLPRGRVLEIGLNCTLYIGYAGYSMMMVYLT